MNLPAHSTRHSGIDVLKGATTLLVVLHHTAITYGGPGGWYYRELKPDGSLAASLFEVFCAVNQAWFMGLFFLLAGYFTPAALQRRGALGYLRERFVRLGIPLLVYIALLGPLSIALARVASGAPVDETLLRLWRLGIIETGPLWFAQALLMFALVVAAWHARPGRAETPHLKPSAVPSNRGLLIAALLCGAVAFALRLVVPVGTHVIGLQLGYFASYVILFAAGCQGARRGWLEALPEARVRNWRRVAWCTLPTLLPLALLAKSVPVFSGNPLGGWNFPALMYAFWEPFVAWGVILALLWRASDRTTPPATPPGPWLAALGRRAFAIYVIHPVVLVGVAVGWRSVAWPPLLKFAVTGSLACLLCFWISGWLLRLPGFKRVL